MLRLRPWVKILAGLWAFLSGFLVGALVPVNFFIIGAVLAVFGLWTYEYEWQGVINGSIGLWLIVCAFFPAMMLPINLWISGIVVVVLAGWRLMDTSTHHPHLPEHPAVG